MPLSRHRRDSNIIWPGFVDAVTTLLMVLIFVVTIFTVMQSVLTDQITSKDNELTELNDQVAALSDALGLERRRVSDLEGERGELRASLTAALGESQRQAGLITRLEGDIAAKEVSISEALAKITGFEAQVAALLSERDRALADVADLEAGKTLMISEAEAMQLALAKARQEIDAGAEAARLAAARSEALEALLADLRSKGDRDTAALTAAQVLLSEAEATRLADAAALEALRQRLAGADSELTAMTLALEAERKRAEDTLTLLAASRGLAEGETAKDQALAMAQAALTAEQEKSLEAARQVELLNQQMAALRSQLASLQGVLDEAEAARADSSLQLASLGRDLNAALAQVAAEQRARAVMEEAERLRLEAENADLARFRSEFFGQISKLLEGREGVQVVGDRFVFSSEVLFQQGAADLSAAGQAQIAGVVGMLNDIRSSIPEGIDWVIRVDGHTDNVPLSGQGAFRDNWELSQARALSVVRFMQNSLGFPPQRLAATGFGEFRPVVAGDTEAARAQNRRIELKLTER